jgi:hypothetical protein
LGGAKIPFPVDNSSILISGIEFKMLSSGTVAFIFASQKF